MTMSVGGVDVSRETFERLKGFEALVQKWTPKINLIAKGTIPELWERHIVDSVQVWRSAPEEWSKWVDFGSGGGFPAILMSIIAAEFRPAAVVELVESDQRKCAFLRTAIRELGLNATVHAQRIEAAAPFEADVISARALASLGKLLEFSEMHRNRNTICLFQKGKTAEQEILEAKENWRFDYVLHPSITDPLSTLIEIKDFQRV